jgi:hypothetical protein
MAADPMHCPVCRRMMTHDPIEYDGLDRVDIMSYSQDEPVGSSYSRPNEET